MKKILFLFVTLFLAGNIFSQEESRLLRFPTMHGNQVVFSYAGDLYTVSLNGGLARKLTNDIGYEMFAHFSPDGKNIAFTAQYDGNTEVYVMPAEGGTPKRLTFTATLGRDDISDRMGPNNIVMAWTNDGKNIIYRSRKQSWDDFVGQLFMVPVEGGLSKELPLSTGGFCSYSPDGKKLAFNRVFREFRTWKYYKGGMADDVRIYDFDTKKITDITNNDNQDIFPMWHGDDIYFCSDRDRTMNLFVYNTKSGTTRKLTNYTDYDIKFPSLGDNGIIFENAGYLSVFDFATQKVTKLSIKIEDDFITGRDKLKDASKFINSADISPDGNRLVMGARGDIFTLPYKDGITRNLTQSPGAHDRDASWSPDGKWIAYLSDKNGEYEIYIQKQDGSEAPIQVTTGADTYKFGLIWSPDSKKILWNDKMLRLQFVDIDSKAVTLVDKSTIWEFASFNWSPDSKWIVYTAPQTNDMSKIILYELSSKTKTDVTDEWYGSDGPAFSADGKYLLFVSQRDFNPIYSQTEWNHAYINMSKVYLATLAKTTPSPFAPENNEVKIDENKTKNEANTENKAKTDKKGGKDKKEKAASANVPDVKIDLDGLKDRIVSLPIDASNYWNLYSNNDKVYYNEMKQGDDGMTFKMFDLKEKKETELGKDMSFTVSANNKKMMIRKSQSYYVVDLPSAPVALKDAVKLSDMKIWVNNREEWNQIYNEAWRQMRDFFYRPTMHGTDWKAMHDKYAVLLPYVNNRHDLNYLIGELIGELNIGHVSGLGDSLAKNIVDYRSKNGPFNSREELKKIPRFGDKAFEQAAGFLRIRDAVNPLDRSAVHPESYALVYKMAEKAGAGIADLMEKEDLRRKINLKEFITPTVGMPTLTDIMNELAKPGRDPRVKFDFFEFEKGIHSIEDVKVGMILPGIVTNITNFGAFVDIGVHQDGLVHVSQLADRYVKDPAEVVKLNQKVMVKVLEVDMQRKRIQLSMKEG